MASHVLVDFGVGKGRLLCHVKRHLESEASRVKVLELLGPMRAAERQRREASATSFYFLHASKVRNCSMERLPQLQDLKRTHPDWIVKKPVDMTSSLLGDYRENMLATSHRWEHPDEPDTKGHAARRPQALFRRQPRDRVRLVRLFPACRRSRARPRTRTSSLRCSPTSTSSSSACGC